MPEEAIEEMAEMTETAETAETAGERARPEKTADEFWEDFYREREQVWTGDANPTLVREAIGLAPGSALDLGCGEGGDAIWLAGQGWRVTATDVSDIALRRGAEHAADAGVGERITWARHDLNETFPEGAFDLVSAQFLHSPVALDGEREAILRRAAEAVAPGGVLLIAGHAGWPSWMEPPAEDFRFPTTGEVLKAVAVDRDRWLIELDGLIERDMPGPEGQSGRRSDNLLRLRRLD